MYANQLHLLAADEQTALMTKFGRNVQIHQTGIEAGGTVITVRGEAGKFILVDMDDSIEIRPYRPEPAVKLPRSNRSIEDLLG